MSRIRIKNFGPIKEGFGGEREFIEIKKVTVFIGNQGTGKSCIAKLIATFRWLEKAYNRGDVEGGLTPDGFVNTICGYQGLTNYFLSNTEIEYHGDIYSFRYKAGMPFMHWLTTTITGFSMDKIYITPKIMYVPAERNFLSTVAKADEVKGLPLPLYTFLDEYERSLDELTEILDLPVGAMKLEYQQLTRTPYVLGPEYKIKLSEASSGLHSVVPLFVVSSNLSLSINKATDTSKMPISLKQARRRDSEIQRVNEDTTDTDAEKLIKIDLIKSKYTNGCFINIVEEPEQNLFPVSQRNLLNSLVAFNNMHKGNELIITTHSPYIINYITLAVKACFVAKKVDSCVKKVGLEHKIDAIVPLRSLISAGELAIYKLDDKGNINKLGDYNGLPTDENDLNERLAETNYLFTDLLEIEDECQ